MFPAWSHETSHWADSLVAFCPPLAMQVREESASVVANAQHDPHCSWSSTAPTQLHDAQG